MFLSYRWYKLPSNAEIALNLLHQSTTVQIMSAYEADAGLFNFDATQHIPLGCPLFIKSSLDRRKSWDYRC